MSPLRSAITRSLVGFTSLVLLVAPALGDQASNGTAGALTTAESVEYQAYRFLYSPAQFKDFAEKTWVSLPYGHAITVLRYLAISSTGKQITGARISVSAVVSGSVTSQPVQVNAADFFADLRRANNSVKGSLTGPLATRQATLTAHEQRTVQSNIGTAITNALSAPVTPAPSPQPVPVPSPVESVAPVACSTPASMNETDAEIQSDVSAISTSPGTFAGFSSAHPVFAYELCEAQAGLLSPTVGFPIQNTISLFPASAKGATSHFNGTIHSNLDIEAPPNLGMTWDLDTQARLFGLTSDLVRFSASAKSSSAQEATASYAIYLGFSNLPIASGSITSDKINADIQNKPQEVVHFSKQVKSIPLGILNLSASFDITGELSNEYRAIGTSRSLFFSMSPSISATATGNVGVVAFISKAELDGTLTIIDLTGDISGAAVAFDDPFVKSQTTYFAGRYTATEKGTALKGSLSLRITLVCPSALKRLLCIQKTFPLYSTPGYTLSGQMLPDDSWSIYALKPTQPNSP